MCHSLTHAAALSIYLRLRSYTHETNRMDDTTQSNQYKLMPTISRHMQHSVHWNNNSIGEYWIKEEEEKRGKNTNHKFINKSQTEQRVEKFWSAISRMYQYAIRIRLRVFFSLLYLFVCVETKDCCINNACEEGTMRFFPSSLLLLHIVIVIER